LNPDRKFCVANTAKIAFDCLVLPVIVILENYPLYRLSTDNQQCPEKKAGPFSALRRNGEVLWRT
jgi:Zn-finger domain-containing protein